MIVNTAIIQTIYQGGGVGPSPLNTYPEDYGSLGLKTAPDALGYPVRACGSYAMWMVQQTGRQPLPYSTLGFAAEWPANVPSGYLQATPAPGLIAIRPSAGLVNGVQDLGHAMFIQAVEPDGNLLVTSYNTDDQGDFALAIWAPSGTYNGVPFTLEYLSFPVAVADA